MKNWKTTVAGIASIIAGVSLYVNDSTQLNEAIGLVVVGFGLIFGADASTKK
jgi:hypothetical protein